MDYNNYLRYLLCKTRVGSVYGITTAPRGYGKTMTTRALYKAIMCEFARYYENISVRWCSGFEILDNGKRRYCHVYMAEK